MWGKASLIEMNNLHYRRTPQHTPYFPADTKGNSNRIHKARRGEHQMEGRGKDLKEQVKIERGGTWR